MKWVLSLVTLLVLFTVGMLAPKEQAEPRATPVAVSTLPPEPAAAPSVEAAAEAVAAAFEQVVPERETARERYKSPISDSEAVEIAMKRGDEIAVSRGSGNTPTLRTEDAEVVAAPVVAPEVAAAPEAVATPEPAPEVAAVETTTPVPAATETAAQDTPAPATTAETWLVTANRVNLRGGPSTDNPVVGSVSAGDALIPVSGLGSDWVEVERPSGETAWIAAQFIARSEG